MNRLLLVALVTVTAALTALSLVVALVRPSPPALWAYVDVLEPYNLPTWFGASVLLLTALVCLVDGLVAAARGRWGTGLWLAAAVGPAVASLCVATGLHTRIDGLARQIVGTTPLTTDWLLPAVVVGLLLTTPFALLARRLPRRRWWLVGALVTFGVGALGSELLARTPGDGLRALAAVAEGVQGIGAAGLLVVAVAALRATLDGTEVVLTSELAAPAPPADGSRELPPVPRRRAFWTVLVATTLALSLVSLAVTLAVPAPGPKLAQWIGYLNVNNEGNLPTWWSVALLLTAGAAHLAAGIAGRAAGARGTIGWFVTAAILAGMSLDDMTSIHERVGDLVRPEGAAAAGNPEGDFSFYWVVPGAGVALIIAVAVGLLALRLHGRPRRLLVLGLAVLFFFALGLESVQGLVLANGSGGPVGEALGYHVEELGENVGALLLLAAATSALALRRRAGGVGVAYLGAGSTVSEDPVDQQALYEAEQHAAQVAGSPTEAIPVVATGPVSRVRGVRTAG